MNIKVMKIRNAGFLLIILSWILWGLIPLIPFLKLDLVTTSIIITCLLVGTNIFWLGIFLGGKSYLLKSGIWAKFKNRFGKDIAG
ncbi:MAG: hypothetical protein WCR72_06350 [Bacteroidota bacterium]